MSTHKTEIKVRFGDTDMAGVVYLPRYVHFFVIAWEEFFESIGVPFDRMIKKEKRGFPPVEVNCRFMAPALCGDLLEVHTQVAQVKKRKICLKFKLYRKEDERLLATGDMTCVPINEKFKATQIPEYILEGVNAFNKS